MKYEDNYRDNIRRDQKQQNNRHRDEDSSGRASDRSENKCFRDESKPSKRS